jgi:hypothetical protein
LSHSESMEGGWEDRGSWAWLVDGDKFWPKWNDGGMSRHGASDVEVRRSRTDGPWGSFQKLLCGHRRTEGGRRR